MRMEKRVQRDFIQPCSVLFCSVTFRSNSRLTPLFESPVSLRRRRNIWTTLGQDLQRGEESGEQTV